VTLAEAFLKEGGILVSCDQNKYMIQKLAKNYSDSDFKHLPGNFYCIDSTDYSEPKLAA